MPIQHPYTKSLILPTLEEIIAQEKPEGVPKEAAWIWGADDEVGRLNLLTPELVKKVLTEESKYGIVSSLNWDITLPIEPDFGRPGLKFDILPHPSGNAYMHDDGIVMNVQSGSQFDGFRHFGHLSGETMYNGLKDEEVVGPKANLRCGIQAASRHGIVGRGVLLDFCSWAEENGIEFDPFIGRPITLDELKAVAKSQNTTFEVGDILLIRSGWMKKYNIEYARGVIPEGKPAPNIIGVEQGEAMKNWLHDEYFAVVGGDMPGFEVWPVVEGTKECLHEFLLACWGVLIGEMLDLEDLAEQCKKTGKYSFVFTAAPFNSPGGVATFANALAIL
ncbi:hypothetical protein V1511DRAFT_40545 [Dipodascopsis uninucleata]